MANTALTCVVLGSKVALGTHGVNRAPMTIPGRRPDRGLRYISPKRTSQKSHTPGATRITDGGKADERAGRLAGSPHSGSAGRVSASSAPSFFSVQPQRRRIQLCPGASQSPPGPHTVSALVRRRPPWMSAGGSTR